MMLYAYAAILADNLIDRFPKAQDRKAVYTYGFELFLSSLAIVLSTFVLSCLFRAIYAFFTFSFIFVSIRLFSGGYHAKTYGHCFMLSNTVYLICLSSAHLIQKFQVEFLCPILAVLSMLVIYVLAPVEHKNHPISDFAYRKNRRNALIVTICNGGCMLTAYFFSFVPHIVCMASVTMAATAILMLIPIIQERRHVS